MMTIGSPSHCLSPLSRLYYFFIGRNSQNPSLIRTTEKTATKIFWDQFFLKNLPIYLLILDIVRIDGWILFWQGSLTTDILFISCGVIIILISITTWVGQYHFPHYIDNHNTSSYFQNDHWSTAGPTNDLLSWPRDAKQCCDHTRTSPRHDAGTICLLIFYSLSNNFEPHLGTMPARWSWLQ